ncbi:hypothetical protein [Variovorax sp. Sphag1AA]|uniref:hypothetical protein n=1 Tax=Variovorax sp. Sphag1AA TaxID=2587027 RepID=UPI00160AC79B|nr:hypothetical protein [Variovorax sp. Sphag1AA]MBB3175888.1 hypothetical protein [Variovorax sp. Sphag1AA]
MMSIHRSHGRSPQADDDGQTSPIPSLGALLRQKLAQAEPQDGERDAADEAAAAIRAAAADPQGGRP